MLSTREEKSEAQNMKSMTIDLLKDIIGEDKATVLGDKLNTQVIELLSAAKKIETIPDEQLKKYISLVGFARSEEKLKAKLLEIISNEGLKEEELNPVLEAVVNKLNIVNTLKSFGDDLHNTLSTLKHNDMLKNETLKVKLAEFFKDQVTDENELNSLTDAVANKFVTEYQTAKDYFKIRESVVVYACEQLSNSASHVEKLNLFSVHMNLGYALDKYRDIIDEKYSNIFDQLSENFMLNIDEIIPMMESMLTTAFDTFEDASEDKSLNEMDFKNKFIDDIFAPFVDKITSVKQQVSILIAQAYRENNQKDLLAAFKFRLETDKLITTIISNGINSFIQNDEQLASAIKSGTIKEDAFKEDLISRTERDISHKMFRNTINQMNTISKFFKAKPAPDNKPDNSPDNEPASPSLRLG